MRTFQKILNIQVLKVIAISYDHNVVIVALESVLDKRNENRIKRIPEYRVKGRTAMSSTTTETPLPLTEESGYRVIKEEEKDGVKIIYVEKKSSMKVYYEKNREKLCKHNAEKLRDRYKNDEEYREKRKAQSREAHKRRMEEKAKKASDPPTKKE